MVDFMETILQQLSAELEVTTEDGYTGTLQLDHTTVKVTVDGYATKTQALSATCGGMPLPAVMPMCPVEPSWRAMPGWRMTPISGARSSQTMPEPLALR